METVVQTLNDLKAEKNNLERQLQEKLKKKAELEQNLEAVNQKWNETRHIFDKKTDEKKKAIYTIKKAQQDAKSQDLCNKRLRMYIDSLEKTIRDESEREMIRRERFMKSMEELTAEFLQLRDFHKKDHLRAKTAEAKKMCANLDEKAESIDSNLEQLFHQLEKAGLQEKIDPYEESIPQETRKIIWLMLQEEEDVAACQLQEILDDVKELQDAVDSV